MIFSQKTQLLLATGLVSALILGSSFSTTTTSVNAAEEFQVNLPILMAQNTPVVKMGTFVKAEAPTTGVARIVRENGQTYLELDSAFSTTDQAPDLHVLLDPDATPPKSYSNSNMNRFVNLGKLHNAKGAQRYPIPSAIQTSGFKSVVIWCRMANATMGYATLK
ncbi:DM13 domain-containing protein [Crocosphaera sp. UHCC 0190]|uniref:DM13 domain-containing protein n=1 Tax=Crocosphaera sp. UHCC 0190 TaxID=3110246 RepID=UPI002B1FD3BF|nr:DM13 domain-containing protein [Crocosphaera sp. UHCC 0190]MEA5510053.1 DM13 domain-containing protein [Crocosphaera sp. UHCC 0190]